MLNAEDKQTAVLQIFILGRSVWLHLAYQGVAARDFMAWTLSTVLWARAYVLLFQYTRGDQLVSHADQKARNM